MDLGPLRTAPAFRWLVMSRTISLFGAQATVIALLVQTKVLTHSAFAVGLLGAAEIPSVIVCGLIGGHLADRTDRRRLALVAECGLGAVTIGLLLNASRAHPYVWVLYVAAAATAGLAATQRPALDSAVPRIVAREQLTAASAALSLSGNASFILGSAVGGVVIASLGADAAYVLDGGSYLISILCLRHLCPLPPRPHDEGGDGPPVNGWRDALAGVRFIAGHPELIGSYLIDLAAMSLAFSETLYPFMASTLHAPWALGLMFSAGAIGATLASATSRWATRVRRHGLAIALAAAVWGGATAFFGIAPDVLTALAALLVAGAADLLSGLFRDTLWNHTVPDPVRGRVAGIEVISYGLGPAIGQLRAGAVASIAGPRFSLWSGGALCTIVIAVICWRLPQFSAYRDVTPDDAPAP